MRTDIFFKYVPSRHINESRIGQNYQILLPVAYHEKKIGYIDKTLYKYILHKNSHSNKDNNNYEKTIRRFQEHENSLVFICIFHIILARDNFRTILIRLRNMKGK